MTTPVSGFEEDSVQIARDEIVGVLEAMGRQEDADRARQELPEPVDFDRDAGLLDSYGLDAQHLAGKIEGQGGLGGQGGLLEGEGV
ncbi:MAG: hypothetical protein AVDCRST_MAG41-3675 [uncultured Corynebacteriales bacterium]|uniref:Uncharacterized protein n=1 Tax=uncultured Mycobacteriales bacterium TaxID=581187 RepID=A0A6J4JLL7_9ACTN|nr:MAG: hypothetical protein AVDCRST_MAG41-3675 [uncultured Corynebacteriales bacterium]